MDEARLLEQLVELSAVGLRDLRAQRVTPLREVSVPIRSVRRPEDGADEHLGQLERVLVADVVSRDGAIADLVEIRLQRLRDPVLGQEIVQDLLRGASADAGCSYAAGGERGLQPLERLRANAARDRRRALEQAEDFARRQVCPALDFRQEVANGKDAGNGEDVMPVDHLGRIRPDLVEVRQERRIVERGDGCLLQLAIPLDRVGLDLLVPPAHVLSPELLRKNLRRGRGAAANLRVEPGQQHEDGPGRRTHGVVRRADRHELPVAEVVHEAHPQGVEQQAVSLRAFSKPPGKRIGDHRAGVTGGRLRKVGLFELPGSRPWSLEFNR